MGPEQKRPWNVNIHYDDLLAGLVPAGAHRVLDVGTGDGFLAAKLARRGYDVTALDADAGVLERARARWADTSITWIHSDVRDHADRYDTVVSNATFHHLGDSRAALALLAGRVGPGGVLGIVTFARPSARDLPWAVGSSVLRVATKRVRGAWQHSAPTHWPPPDTVTSLKRAATDALPGVRVRRLALGRVLLVWHAPSTFRLSGTER